MQAGPWLSPCLRAAAASGCSSLSFWVHKPGPESWDSQNVLCEINGLAVHGLWLLATRLTLCPSCSCPPVQVRPCLWSAFCPAIPQVRVLDTWGHSLLPAWHRGFITCLLQGDWDSNPVCPGWCVGHP